MATNVITSETDANYKNNPVTVYVITSIKRGPGWSQGQNEKFSIVPESITRQRVGRDLNRYYYQVRFKAFAPMMDHNGAPITEGEANIVRALNKGWKPPKTGWVGKVWTAAKANVGALVALERTMEVA